ncbi:MULTISPECIES: hypothetical protein [Lysobacteraceae]|uniref:Secreted protein n=1 Tax=Novilysobacter avium TaxID=2781023 RepID=A0A7S6ZUX2_9GAMM|nr:MULTISPECIES: hypothetical protein [Lysobacter]QOW22562.1 hypothetical protein INQ42_02890 [Lysobacter avium]QOW25074.1 hypothetical protein INQ43_03155 [Lysobacter sp. H23M47]
MTISRILLPATFAAALAACSPSATDTTTTTTAADTPSAATADPQQAFFDRLTALCGKAFEGSVLTDRPVSDGPDPFRDQTLTMHVRECSDREIRIPFNVGDNYSRTWVLTRTGDGLRLKHDHRLEDGSDDPVTMYGGETANPGSANRQEFPVDSFSQAMFTREGMDVSNTNVWAIEIEPEKQFVYELARTGEDRMFRVGFDLTRPIATPPAPWGGEAVVEAGDAEKSGTAAD